MISVAITIFSLLLILLIYKLIEWRREFLSVRISSLSTASESDAVGGVGISIVCASPTSVAVVVSLLDSRYPLSEVVVAIDSVKHSNLLQQLKIRYALAPYQQGDCEVYRSRDRAFRRLVVVAKSGEADTELLYDLAARNALFDNLLRVPPSGRLFHFAVGKFAELIASERAASVEIITTAERGVYLLSRRVWRSCGGYAKVDAKSLQNRLHIAEPLGFGGPTAKGYALLVERSRYNFFDFLALNIMRYGNKLLSLVKPA